MSRVLLSVGEIVQRKRQDLGISRSELGKRSNVSPSTITKLEDGKPVKFMKSTCRGIAKSIGISAKALWAISKGISTKKAISAYPYHGYNAELPEQKDDDLDNLGDAKVARPGSNYLSKVQNSLVFRRLEELGEEETSTVSDEELANKISKEFGFTITKNNIRTIRYDKLGWTKRSDVRRPRQPVSPVEPPAPVFPEPIAPIVPESTKPLPSKENVVMAVKIRKLESKVLELEGTVSELEAFVKSIREALSI